MGTVASTNLWWRVERPTSDAGDSVLAQKATMMNPSSELSACWRGQLQVLSVQGYWMRGSSLYPSAKRGSGQLSLKKNLTRPNGLRGETQQSTVMDDELDMAQWAPCRGEKFGAEWIGQSVTPATPVLHERRQRLIRCPNHRPVCASNYG